MKYAAVLLLGMALGLLAQRAHDLYTLASWPLYKVAMTHRRRVPET